MGHSNIWNAHPKNYGPGSLFWFPALTYPLTCSQPCLWESSWIDQKVWAYVLQAVFPQQCQGNWIYQVSLER
ncbi:hypothetical protein Nepgr_018428 [Nepenthes gracilis]|uniref:Uncharacterized protein n=1 Tax=Nepenthes gracilis TaxID=150966 RepID=A0AAD3XT26_NEPGR|nr:hypothetical protein Nepgr_018428 [Nepenthes gracilis]